MSYFGRVEEARSDVKKVCILDPSNGPDTGSNILSGQSDGGGLGGKEQFKPRTYVLHDSQKTMRRQYK
jgi:hypothetical protein